MGHSSASSTNSYEELWVGRRHVWQAVHSPESRDSQEAQSISEAQQLEATHPYYYWLLKQVGRSAGDKLTNWQPNDTKDEMIH